MESYGTFFYQKHNWFGVKLNYKKSVPFFLIRPQIFPATNKFCQPLLWFAADTSATWQHCPDAMGSE
jgi:hypothetical protein